MNFSLLLLPIVMVLSDTDPAIHFDTEIMPVLTKAGCNSGACHGAAAGRGGFHLSLLGSNSADDYEAIVLAFEGRRINLAHPDRSLILLKATEQIEHGGDVALEDGSPGTERLLHWIQSGASRGDRRVLTNVTVTPVRHFVAQVPATIPLEVLASFDNQPAEDVTHWTVFTSSDVASLEIDGNGKALVHRRGQHVIIARFLDRVVPIQITSPMSDNAVDHSNEPRASFIDDHILRVLTELRMPVSQPASDSVWIRRVFLDLTGRLPEPSVVRDFLKDVSSDKRERLVDQLLNSDAFADYWTLRFSKLLRIHSLPNEKEGIRAYSGWLRQQLDQGTSLNEMARQMLTATGDSHVVGPANFSRMVSDARDHAELVGQAFMGQQPGCANCHNHPLDKWTQDDYHGLAAVFAKLDRGRNVRITPRGAVTNLRTNEPAIPRIPGEHDLPSDGDNREAIAHWLTSGQNRYFAKATVNRLWRAMFGRGLVEPSDDLRETNLATHPELLNQLADDFVEHQYSLRYTLRLIALSCTYARSSIAVPGNEIDDRFYSRSYQRGLEPEVLLDSIADVTGVALEFPEQPAGTRAVAIVDSLEPAPSLDVLGRCSRAAGCKENATSSAGLSTQLHLLNGDLVNSRVTSKAGRLHQHIAAGTTDEEILRDFYLRGFCREPTIKEIDGWKMRIVAVDSNDRTQRLEDFLWSLLNSRQFMDNH